jgi:hypothetical protein
MDDHNGERRRLARIVEWIVIVLAVALAVLVVFFVREYLLLRRAQVMNARQSLEEVLKAHGPLNAGDTGIIQDWMTFDYLNRLFGLPADYLKTALSIADPHYPQLYIGGYARSAGVSEAAALANVQAAIRNYFLQNTSSSMSVSSST